MSHLNEELFILGQQSVEPVRKTKREAKAFQDWLDGQKAAEGLPMAKIDLKRLNLLLGSYLLNKRGKNGEEYEPSSLAGTFSSIKDRQLLIRGVWLWVHLSRVNSITVIYM